MTIEWNNRDYQFDSNGGNSNSFFQEHDRQMREFRTSHADVALVNGLRLDKATFLDSLLFLRINCIIETGGSALPEDATDWSILAPLLRVARYKLSQN